MAGKGEDIAANRHQHLNCHGSAIAEDIVSHAGDDCLY
jgi:hypothetical protein